MQPINDMLDENQKRTNRRPKSFTRLPKQMPSYIVAFAVHETYDDIATAQQMICNKRSLQSSTSSVSPAISISKTTTDRNSAPKIPDTDFTETPDELNNKVEEEGNNDDHTDIQNELPETTDYFVVNNQAEDDVNKPEDSITIIDSRQIKKQVNRLSKKKRQNHHRLKNVNFKYKKPTKREDKAGKKPSCAAKLKETFYSNSVSRVISRKSLLKSVGSILSDEENNNESIHSSPSTTKKSFISYSSEDTLTLQGSTSSKNEDLNSIGTISSVIKIPSQRALPYKTEVINVSVAVAYNPNKDNERNPLTEPYRSIIDRDLLSTETLVEPAHLLTSDSLSSGASDNVQNIYLQAMNINNISDGTLKPNSENTYVVGNTSSEADDSLQSESTLAPNSETFMYAENLRQTPPNTEKPEKDKNYNRIPLLDTVINMGIFPEINPSTSSAIDFNHDLNSVFVTGDSGKYIKNPIYKEEKISEIKKDKSKYEFLSTLKKSFEATTDVNLLKNVNLPNEGAIKAIINETDKMEAKFWSEGLVNYPGSIAELWDRLVLVVDTAVKRLEHSLTEKIINEIRNQLPTFEKQATRMNDEIFVVDIDKSQGDKVLSNKQVFVDKREIHTEIDESLQCTLVGNKVIDNIMMKLSVEGPKASIPGTVTKSFPKIKRPKIFRDYFEVLKPPTVESALVEGKGDTITVSTTTPSEIEAVDSFNRVKEMLAAPITFLRENLLVVTSVPTFFVMLLCVYGLIIFVMKPW